MVGIRIDTERQMLREVDKALNAWGSWSSDKPDAHLGYPDTVPFLRVRGRYVDGTDMSLVDEVERAYTTWKMVTLESTSGAIRRRNLLLLFILKIHYTEVGTAADKAHHTARMFHQKMSRGYYYILLREARLKLAMLMF